LPRPDKSGLAMTEKTRGLRTGERGQAQQVYEFVH
jgi:hypothetical protein